MILIKLACFRSALGIGYPYALADVAHSTEAQVHEREYITDKSRYIYYPVFLHDVLSVFFSFILRKNSPLWAWI